MSYEKNALEHGSPFTWSDKESLAELSKPERIIQIKADYEKRKQKLNKKQHLNALRADLNEFVDNDDLYNDDEGNGACLICTK